MKYQYQPLRASRNTALKWERWWTDATKCIWPTTFTYNLSIPKVTVDPHAKNQGRRSNGSNRRGQTNQQTDATKRIISPASRSIKIVIWNVQPLFIEYQLLPIKNEIPKGPGNNQCISRPKNPLLGSMLKMYKRALILASCIASILNWWLAKAV